MMKITRTSMITGVSRTLEFDITSEQYEKFANGELIQDAMPNLTDAEREFILTGITEDEWYQTFGQLVEDD